MYLDQIWFLVGIGQVFYEMLPWSKKTLDSFIFAYENSKSFSICNKDLDIIDK